jgi:hypothetical protein
LNEFLDEIVKLRQIGCLDQAVLHSHISAK